MFKKFYSLILVLVAVISVSACAQSSSSSSNTNEETFDPVTITHAYGETTITKKPERVVTLKFGNQDIVLALGIVPVGFSAANFGVEDGSGMLPWTKQKLAELGENNPNVFNDIDAIDVEAVAATEPDIILAPYSALTQSEYDVLSEIAPVVPYISSAWTIEWKEWVRVTAKALGMVSKGEELISEIENMIVTKAANYPLLAGKKVIWTNFRTNDLSKVGTYTPTDARGAFLKALGLDYPQSYYDIFTDTTKYSLNISSEYADILNDADLIIGYGTEDTWSAVENHDIWKNITPIKNGAIAKLGNGGYLAVFFF